MNSAGLTVKHEAGAAGVEEGETGVAQDQRQVQCPPVISVISADNSVIIIPCVQCYHPCVQCYHTNIKVSSHALREAFSAELNVDGDSCLIIGEVLRLR